MELERRSRTLVPSDGGAVLQPIIAAQGAYYVTTGLWPLVHMPSFVAVTGPKKELWLVRAVGSLIGVIGAGLVVAAARRKSTPEVAVIGMGSAAALTAVDVVYAGKRRISPVYLLDALAEVGIIAAWAVALRRAPARLRER
jgi:hypothetical protein